MVPGCFRVKRPEKAVKGTPKAEHKSDTRSRSEMGRVLRLLLSASVICGVCPGLTAGRLGPLVDGAIGDLLSEKVVLEGLPSMVQALKIKRRRLKIKRVPGPPLHPLGLAFLGVQALRATANGAANVASGALNFMDELPLPQYYHHCQRCGRPFDPPRQQSQCAVWCRRP